MMSQVKTEEDDGTSAVDPTSRDDLANCQLQNHTSILHQTDVDVAALMFQKPQLNDFQKRELRLMKNRVFPAVPCQWIPAGLQNPSSTSMTCTQLSCYPQNPSSLCCHSLQGHHMYTQTVHEKTEGESFSWKRWDVIQYGCNWGWDRNWDDLANCQLQNHTSILHQTDVDVAALMFQKPQLNDFQKRELRLMKNREAARECRRKKKEYVRCLENRVAMLENLNKALREEIRSFKDVYQENME